MKISATIIALNEERNIARAIESLRCADEIVVVDSGSTDGTRELAASLGARVIERAWPGYGPQKRFAEEQCRHVWMLNLDADEVVCAIDPRALPALARLVERTMPAIPPVTCHLGLEGEALLVTSTQLEHKKGRYVLHLDQ